MPKKVKKVKSKKEPLPKEGTKTKYVFWFLTNHGWKALGIAAVVFFMAAFFLSDIELDEDKDGKSHLSIDKKAVQLNSLKKLKR